MKNLEVRALSNVEATEDMTVEGYALKFNTLSEDLGGFFETILPTALNATDLNDVRMFFDHDSSKVLGRSKNGTLELTIDEVGLKVKCVFPDTTYARDLYHSIARGDINQMSFGFILAVNGDNFIKQSDGTVLRELTNIEKIYEVSIVSIPAYSDTDIVVAQRNMTKAMTEQSKRKLLLELELTKLKMTL